MTSVSVSGVCNDFAGPLRPTRNAIRVLRGGSAAQTADNIEAWLDAQLVLPPTLHRAYFRERVNPVMAVDGNSLYAPVAATRTGRPRSGCAVGSRWQRNAFSWADMGLSIEVAAFEGGGYSMSVGGVLRTVVSEFGRELGDGGSASFLVCHVVDQVGRELVLVPAGMSLPTPGQYSKVCAVDLSQFEACAAMGGAVNLLPHILSPYRIFSPISSLISLSENLST